MFESSESETESAMNQQRDSTETQSGSSRTSTAESGTAKTSSLSDDIIALLENVVRDFGGSLTGEDSSIDKAGELSDILGTRAKTAQEDIIADIDPIIAGARREGERGLKTLETQLAQQAGGSLGNSFVTAATAEGREGLETNLARLEAELNLKARDTQTNELGAAIQALSEDPSTANVANFVSLVQTLKGAQVEQESEKTGTSETETELSRVLKELVEGTSTSESESSGFSIGFGSKSGDSGGKLFGIF